MKSVLNSNVKLMLGGVVMALTSMQTLAHDIYIWPSYFTVNSDKPTKVPVDVSASHTTFRPDFSMPSDGVTVLGVDGKKVRRIGNYYEGARRSTFDLSLEEEGTYALRYSRDPSYFTRYKIGKRKTEKRLRASKSEAKKQMPEGAFDAETARYETISMSYVTNKAPTNEVLAAKNKGFELIPVTHPADYVTGEELEVSLMFDGKPASDLDVVIELEGPQYREDPKALELKSDKDGMVRFEFEQGGRYMLKVNHKKPVQSTEADYHVTRIFYAFEVIFE